MSWYVVCIVWSLGLIFFFFFKQKTAYEIVSRDWSSDVCSSDLKIKAATSHLKGVKIAIMGCIVNGPGEMADADFGYVGGAPGKVNLYVGKTAVKFNIPEAEAVDRLKGLIREHGKWVEPVLPEAVLA